MESCRASQALVIFRGGQVLALPQFLAISIFVARDCTAIFTAFPGRSLSDSALEFRSVERILSLIHRLSSMLVIFRSLGLGESKFTAIGSLVSLVLHFPKFGGS